ncbi:YopX family protein [Acutalibacter sp. 1XD8-36]|uniref:YopX family protein n=1 Tax=Acutalibacter sp. 1XD8-36 TaxID=2320852 RepID=UPI0014135774|nr:YopX family protein [Acutalibacter sp. 1XD8-36]NBJ88141.1 hypothetical protein [Acutalibacter sp. 1XD8-36]
MADIATLRRILAEEYGIHSDKELHDALKNNPKVNIGACVSPVRKECEQHEKVFWHQKTSRFLRTATIFFDDCPEMTEFREHEVVGNIYDNPELLERTRELQRFERLGKDVVLLCYEDIRKGPDDWCHRRTFADWWLKNTGEALPELFDPTPDPSKPRQAVSKRIQETPPTTFHMEQLTLF